MRDLKDLTDIDQETLNLIDSHIMLIGAPLSQETDSWSLEQPSPNRYVPSIVTDCAFDQEEN